MMIVNNYTEKEQNQALQSDKCHATKSRCSFVAGVIILLL